MLTAKQKQLLEFIALYMDKENGLSPSYEEMMIGLSLKSKNGIHRLVTSLEERGYIRRIPFLACSIEIIRLPNEPLPIQILTAEDTLLAIERLLNRRKQPNLR